MNVYPKGIPRILVLCFFTSTVWGGKFDLNEYVNEKIHKVKGTTEGDSLYKKLLKNIVRKKQTSSPKEWEAYKGYQKIMSHDGEFLTLIEMVSGTFPEDQKGVYVAAVEAYNKALNAAEHGELMPFRTFFSSLFLKLCDLTFCQNDPSLNYSSASLKNLYSKAVKNKWFEDDTSSDALRERVGVTYFSEES